MLKFEGGVILSHISFAGISCSGYAAKVSMIEREVYYA